ncbi:MAG: hypothetical protein HUU10_04350 [Bacteroidetes bacterium]|nr:hypothetical protein [Bacteroidota bacterium]
MIETIIGIDPGVRAGLAIVTMKDRTMTIQVSTFFPILDLIKSHDPEKTIVIIEDPNELSITRRATYQKKKYYSQLAAGRQNPTGFMSNAEIDHISQSVGKNKREAQLYIEFCKRNKYQHLTYYPHHNKQKLAGLNEYCEKLRLALNVKSIQQHGIDAGTMIAQRYNDVMNMIREEVKK